MIQRKQSVFLLLAVILSVACLSLPIGSYTPSGMGLPDVLTNLWIRHGNGVVTFTTCPLFILLLLSSVLSVLTILAYKNRRLQIVLCSLLILLHVGWYIVFAVFGTVKVPEAMTFRPAWTAAFPLVSLILTWLARKGVIADEKLVRAADRIR